MSNGEIDRIPVNQLSQRYDLARSAVYTRMEALRIKPEKIGNKSYINAQQLGLMDDLHQFINRGGTTAEFLDARGLPRDDQQSSEQSSGLSTVQPDLIRMVTAIAAEIVSRVQPQLPMEDPFDYFETLEKAAQNGWILSTSEVADLLDILPSEINQYGDRFSEAGFIFTRSGYRAGGEVGWKVSKPLK